MRPQGVALGWLVDALAGLLKIGALDVSR